MTLPGTPTESAVIIAVPEAEPAVGRHRADLDPAASWGVPAHVTVLYPFLAPAVITDATRDTLAAAVGRVPAFGCRFRRTAWFGSDVLWLAPEPSEGLRALTAAVCEVFPRLLPYGGEHDDVVPHLTVGLASSRGLAALRAAEAAVQSELPFTAQIRAVQLMVGSPEPGAWRSVAELPLSAA